MHIEKFDQSHNRHIRMLLDAHAIKCSISDELPKHGYVAYYDDIIVAAGFLRICEGGIGIYDSYITNSKVKGKFRDEALDLITNKLEKDAKSLGLKGLFVFTKANSIVDRSLRHGFVKSDQTLLIKKV